jgi:hypothetical protein
MLPLIVPPASGKAPRFVKAPAAVVELVPPLAIASVTDKPAAVPDVFWLSVGTSEDESNPPAPSSGIVPDVVPVLSTAAVPNPKLVLAVDALDTSLKLFDA